MRKTDLRDKSTVNLYERLNAVSMDERERAYAKAQLARAEYVAELVDRATGAFGRLMHGWIVRPLGRWFAKPIRVEAGCDRP